MATQMSLGTVIARLLGQEGELIYRAAQAGNHKAQQIVLNYNIARSAPADKHAAEVLVQSFNDFVSDVAGQKASCMGI